MRIPANIGDLRMLKLRRLDMLKNEFSSHILSSLANMTQLYSLPCVTGSIPSSFGKLSYLQELDLSRNSLNGTTSQTSNGSFFTNYFLEPGSKPFHWFTSFRSWSQNCKILVTQMFLRIIFHMESNFFEGTIPPSQYLERTFRIWIFHTITCLAKFQNSFSQFPSRI